MENIIHKIIDELHFGLFSPQNIRRQSVAEIQTADTYDEDGTPIISGLMDGRLGTLEPRQRCKTCGNTAIRCPGHFGHIELTVPIIHIEFAKIIHNILQATCRNCGRILLPESHIEKINALIKQNMDLIWEVPNNVYKKILKDARKKDCPYCGAQQSKIEFAKPTTFYEILEEGAQRLTQSMVRERLERIPDEDLKLFGFTPATARPEWMVLQVLPVPPVYVRPSITLESGIRSEDD